MSEYSITQEDLESLADTYDQIRNLYKQKSLSSEKNLSKDLESYLRESISELSEKLSTETVDEIAEVHTVYTKYKIFDLCILKISEFFNTLMPGSGKVLQEASAKQGKIFESLYFKTLQSLDIKNQSLVDNDQAQKELDQVLKAAESLESKIVKLTTDKKELKEEIEKIKIENKEYIEHLEEENKTLLEKILRNARYHTESQDTTIKMGESRDNRLYSPFRYRATTPPPTFHDMTLKQCEEVIEEIYQAKGKYDQKCLESKQPYESLDNFIHIYYTQKYGLKSLKTQWLNLLNKALSRYESEINVIIFRKIRFNEIPEDFVNNIKGLPAKIAELIRSYYRSKHPYMQEKVIKTMQEECYNKEIDEELCTYILSIFTTKDKYKEKLLSNAVVSKSTRKKKKLINFKDMYRVVLELTLEDYESKLDKSTTKDNEL